MKRRLAVYVLATLLSSVTAAHAADPQPLKVCLDEDRPPLSSHRRGKRSGGPVDRTQTVPRGELSRRSDVYLF